MQGNINIQKDSKKNRRESRGKLPLDLPMPRNRYRRNRYYSSGRYWSRYEEENDSSVSLLRNMVICAVVVLIVVILKSIDTPFTRNVLGYVRDAVTTEFDIDETLGKLKFVDNWLPEGVKAVFSEQTADDQLPLDIRFSVPAEGKVIAFFGEELSGKGNESKNGIDIQGSHNDRIYAVYDGYVTAIGEDEIRGKYIEITQESNIVTLYTGCSEFTVDVGYQVKKGVQIGKMGRTEDGTPIVHFETWVNGKPVDPLLFINSGN